MMQMITITFIIIIIVIILTTRSTSGQSYFVSDAFSLVEPVVQVIVNNVIVISVTILINNNIITITIIILTRGFLHHPLRRHL